MNSDNSAQEDPLPELGETLVDDSPPWEEIDTGRYQPRRIRGSCRGRILG